MNNGRVGIGVEVTAHLHLVPEPGESGEELAERALVAGYTVLRIEDDGRVLVGVWE